MFRANILVILTNPLNNAGAEDTIARARASAAFPERLRFALPSSLKRQSNADDSCQEKILFYTESIAQIVSYLNDETHFLLLSGAHAFRSRWDEALYGQLRALSQKRSLLTASITPGSSQAPVLSEEASTIRLSARNGLHTLRHSLPQLRKYARAPLSPTPLSTISSAASEPEVCLPALRPLPEGEGAVIIRGMPMVCAARPASTCVADPAFVFGPIEFLDENGLSLDNLSLTAFLMGYAVFVLTEALAWPLAAPKERILRLPEHFPGTAAARFAQLSGITGSQPRTQAKAALGLFGPDETYAQRMPLQLKMTQQFSSLSRRFFEKQQPMIVSAFIDLPDASCPQDDYTLRFGFLRQLENLPMLLYTGGSQERLLRASMPNTQSYPDNALLPLSLLQEGMTRSQHFARSKPLLMQRAAKRHAEFTHMAWTDIGILPHPIPAQAMPNFDPLMDDRIHLAAVDGIPDGSFVVVPVRYLDALSREVLSITHLDAELKRGFSEALLWERLFMKHPDWFVIHPMPRRRLLFLTVFDRQLLSKDLQHLLSGLPKPFYGTPADGRRAAANDRPSKRSDFP